MQITLDLPDELVSRLSPLEDKLPQILELGLRELNASSQMGFTGVAEVLEFLATLPTPEEIIALRPSEALQTQISNLLEKNRTQGLTPQLPISSVVSLTKEGIGCDRSFCCCNTPFS